MFNLSANEGLKDNVFAHLFHEVRKNTLKEYFNDIDDENQAIDEIKNLSNEDQIHLLEKIYDKSRLVGQYMVKNYGDTYSTEHIIAFLNQTDMPCLATGWKLIDADSTWRRFRNSCTHNPSRERCNFWRQAIKGLVAGLGSSTKYSRHRSIGHGDNTCLDYLYDSDYVDHKNGHIPDDISQAFSPLIQQLSEKGIRLILEGFSEGIIYYSFTDKNNLLKNSRETVAESVSRLVREKFPAYTSINSRDILLL